jgi:hypothetical protein
MIGIFSTKGSLNAIFGLQMVQAIPPARSSGWQSGLPGMDQII